jgi:CBS domain containing-hemolysin-like protein
MERRAEDGSRRAASVMLALKELSFHLSGAQLGITLTSLIVGFLIRPSIASLLEGPFQDLGLPRGTASGVAVVVALLLATATEMVVGELVPKNIAIARPTPTAFAIATPLRLVNGLFRPLILFLNAAANWTVRLFGVEPQEELSQVRSLDELNYLIHSSRREGTIEETEFSLLARAASLESKTAGDALTPRTSIVAIHIEEKLGALNALALETGFSRFPVYGRDLDDINGTLLVKDMFRFEPDERPHVPVAEIVTDPLVVPESRDLASLLVEMRRTPKHMAVVIDEYGGTAGIITLEDILEELVGDIEDEYDREATVITPSPEGVHVLDGLLRPDEVEELCGFETPEGDYDTLAGFLLSLFDRIPKRGDHIAHAGWEFKVIQMEGRRISRVLAVSPPSRDEEDRE